MSDPNFRPTHKGEFVIEAGRGPRITRRVHGHDIEEPVGVYNESDEMDVIGRGLTSADMRTSTGGATGFARFAAAKESGGQPLPVDRGGRSGFAQFASQKEADGDGTSPEYLNERTNSDYSGSNDIMDDRPFQDGADEQLDLRMQPNTRPRREEGDFPQERSRAMDRGPATTPSHDEMDLFDELAYDSRSLPPRSRKTTLDDPGLESSPNFFDEIDRVFPIKR